MNKIYNIRQNLVSEALKRQYCLYGQCDFHLFIKLKKDDMTDVVVSRNTYLILYCLYNKLRLSLLQMYLLN